MPKLATSAKSVGNTLLKLYRGVPGEPRRRLIGMRNVGQAAWFLIARKLGVNSSAKLSLGHAGKVHQWSLVERSDLSVLEEVFLNKEYALDIPAPDVVLDLGANIGAASVYFAQAWPKARIYAVEPHPEIYTRLLENTAPFPGIVCLNYAIADRDGMLDFVMSTNHIASSLHRPDPYGRVIAVQARTLLSLMAEIGVDHVGLLKFDVEGSEEDLFDNATVLARLSTIVGEVHKDLISGSEADFLSQFEGFRVKKRTQDADLFVMSAVRVA